MTERDGHSVLANHILLMTAYGWTIGLDAELELTNAPTSAF